MSAAEGDRARSVLVVCTANICRSPLAEGLLRASLEGTGLTVRSAGIQPLVGHPAVPESVDYLRRRTGVTLRHHGKALTSQLVSGSGAILTMTERQRAEVVRFSPGALRRVFTLRQFVRLEPYLPGGSVFGGVDQLAEALARCRAVAGPAAEGEDDVVDPYGGTPEMYEYSFALIARSTSRTADVLRARITCRDSESIPPPR
ncbi:low molecular weight phosphatase family protein [Brachybacterium paraconglomeratum]|uniref:arsenate reductase/protein-tyrosine-phosphatase family protein n=1 Tax=Brachybacterium paraconglomeratum TaxID=173362 RepID=UPI0037C7093D